MEFSVDAIKSLLCDEIWHSHYSCLNDPFELSVICNKELPETVEELAKYLKKANYFAPKNYQGKEQDFAIQACLTNDYEALKKMTLIKLDLLEESLLESFDKNRAYISCMSKLNDQPLMWSHYAKSYSGICIAYDIEAINKDGYKYKEVIYEKEFATMDFKTILADDNSEHMDQLDKVLRTKSTDWKYEKEVRCIKAKIDDGNALKGIVRQCPNAIRAITFGHRMGEKELSLLRELARLKEVPLYIASPTNTEYKVSIEPYNPD